MIRIRFGFHSEQSLGFTVGVDPQPVPGNHSGVDELDYAILRLHPDQELARVLAVSEPLQLSVVVPEIGDELLMIHHPGGGAQRLTTVGCRVSPLESHEAPVSQSIVHRCDARLGSSGAPLIDARTLTVVGVHHLGINRWHANFAKRMSAIATHSEIIAEIIQPPSQISEAGGDARR